MAHIGESGTAAVMLEQKRNGRHRQRLLAAILTDRRLQKRERQQLTENAWDKVEDNRYNGSKRVHNMAFTSNVLPAFYHPKYPASMSLGLLERIREPGTLTRAHFALFYILVAVANL